MLPQCVPDLDKKLNSPFYFFLSGPLVAHRSFFFLPFNPYLKSCHVLWTNMKE